MSSRAKPGARVEMSDNVEIIQGRLTGECVMDRDLGILVWVLWDFGETSQEVLEDLTVRASV